MHNIIDPKTKSMYLDAIQELLLAYDHTVISNISLS